MIRSLRSRSFRVRRLYVAWGHRDGLHLIGPRWHFHGFVWLRGRRRVPVYLSLRRVA